MHQKAIDKLERIRAQMVDLLDEAVEVLMDHPGIAHRSYETWVARIDTALNDRSEFCISCDYTMDDAIRALREWRRVA